jgi:hypothetical protein
MYLSGSSVILFSMYCGNEKDGLSTTHIRSEILLNFTSKENTAWKIVKWIFQKH